MTNAYIVAAAVMTVAGGLTLPGAQAQSAFPGLKRTDLLKHDFSIPGREVVQLLVEFPPGTAAASHAHPGEELVYVTEGVLEYTLEGKPPVTLKAGEALFIPYGTNHAVKNVGSGKAAELGTYIVEKEKPLVKLAE